MSTFQVIGGHAAAEGNFPFIAFVDAVNASGMVCTGSIVGRRHVLTAAHCVDNASHPMPENIDPSKFAVLIGSVWIWRAIPLSVKGVFTGPQWTRTSDGKGRPNIKVDDIAVLELAKPIEFNDYAQPICLPKSFRERPGDPGYFVGWGARNIVPEPHNKSTDYDYPAVANENIVTFRKWRHCREDLICTGQHMRLANKVDSGGPLMVNRKGVWFQVGTNSAGARRDGMGQGKFSRVTSYCKWFKNVTNGEVNCV